MNLDKNEPFIYIGFLKHILNYDEFGNHAILQVYLKHDFVICITPTRSLKDCLV